MLEDKEGVQVYDILGELEKGEPRQIGVNLIALAGQLGHVGRGYFFERQSSELIWAAAETPVLNESGEVVGTIRSPATFFSCVLLGKDKRFDPNNHQYHMEPKISDTQLGVLWKLRNELLEQLRKRGTTAQEEYALIGVEMGGEELGEEELRELVENALGK